MKKTTRPLSFWRSLFCKHEWNNSIQEIYETLEDKKGSLPIRVLELWECYKCSKRVKRKLL